MGEKKKAPGWYPYDDTTQAYWDGEWWTEHRAPLAKKKQPISQWRILLASVVVLFALAGLWSTGMFDEFLSQFGLNYGPCAENLLTGNKICGDELDAFCDQRFFAGANPDVC